MAVAFRSVASDVQSTGTSITVTKPTGTVAGDILVLRIYWDANGGPAIASVPSDFRVAVDEQDFLGTWKQKVFWKPCGSAEPANYTTIMSATCYKGIDISAYSGADLDFPIGNGEISKNADNTATAVGLSITASRDGSMLIHLLTSDTGTRTSGPSGMTNQLTYDSNVYLDTEAVDSGSTGNRDSTYSGALLWVTQMLVLRPSEAVAVSAGGGLLVGSSSGWVGSAKVGADEQASGAMSATMAGTSSMSSSLKGAGALVATMAGSSSMTGTLRGAGALIATMAGSSSMAGSLSGLVFGSVTMAGSSSMTGTLRGAGTLIATMAGSSSMAGTLRGAGVMAALMAGSSAMSSVLGGAGAMTATMAGSSSMTGTGTLVGAMSVLMAGVSSLSASLVGAGALSLTTGGTSAMTSTLRGAGALSLTTVSTGSMTGTLRGAGAMAALLAGSSSMIATLAGAGALSSVSMAGAGSMTGTLTDGTAATILMAGSSSFTATLTGLGTMSAVMGGSSSMSGVLRGAGDASVLFAGSSSLSATLRGVGNMAVAMAGSSDMDVTVQSGMTVLMAGTSSMTGTLTGLGGLSVVMGGAGSMSATISFSGAPPILDPESISRELDEVYRTFDPTRPWTTARGWARMYINAASAARSPTGAYAEIPYSTVNALVVRLGQAWSTYPSGGYRIVESLADALVAFWTEGPLQFGLAPVVAVTGRDAFVEKVSRAWYNGYHLRADQYFINAMVSGAVYELIVSVVTSIGPVT